MPFQSKAQAGAMFAAASGKSTLGIPPKVGADFVNASKGESVSALPARAPAPSPFPEYMDAQRGAKKKTHRGRRSQGKGAKSVTASVDHHVEAKGHLMNAHSAATPKASMAHLFKALSSLKKSLTNL